MDYIKHIYYINLDRRPDRRAHIEEELARMDLTATRFPAIEYTPGHVGCFKSHLAVLKLAKEHDFENVLILEDDFQFLVTKDEFYAELRAFFESGMPYDVLMLSYNLKIGEPCNETVGYVKEAITASGYIVHRRFYDKLIELYEWSLPYLIGIQKHWLYMNDAVWIRLQPQSEWFYFMKRIGHQRPSYSDLEKREVDYGC
jgi:glycosyl transferase family 25